METEENPEIDKKDEESSSITEEMRLKIERFEYFIRCPCCQTSDNKRNQVQVPCGHLICDSCAIDQVRCCMCDTPVEGMQLLLVD